jgi:hypothetical protein
MLILNYRIFGCTYIMYSWKIQAKNLNTLGELQWLLQEVWKEKINGKPSKKFLKYGKLPSKKKWMIVSSVIIQYLNNKMQFIDKLKYLKSLDLW